MRHGPVRKSFAATAPLSPTALRPAPPSTAAGPGFSASPSPSYRQHRSVIEPRIDSAEFRPHWLVRTHALALLENGRIDRDQYAAAVAWRAWHEVLGRQRTQRWDNLRVDCALAPGAVLTKELAAARQLHQAAAALGAERFALLNWSIVDDMSWSHLARKLRLSDKTVVIRVVQALEALAMWRAGAPIPPPPRTRPYNRPGSR
jgi:hypothetical protein